MSVKTYSEYEEILRRRVTRNIINFGEHSSEIESFISLLLASQDEIQNDIESKFTEENPVPEPKGYLIFLNARVNSYLIAAYRLFLDCLPDPSRALLRVVLEMSMSMYAIEYCNKYDRFYAKFAPLYHKFDKLAQTHPLPVETINLEKELRELVKDGTTIRRLVDDLYAGQGLTISEDGKIPKELEYNLRLKFLEDEFDIKAHAHIRGAMSNFEYKKGDQEDLIKMICILCAYHGHAVSNIFEGNLSEETKERIIARSRAMLSIASHPDLGGLSAIPTPNKESVASRLKYKVPWKSVNLSDKNKNLRLENAI